LLQIESDTVERGITWWQCALRWAAWLTFLGLAVYNSQGVYFPARVARTHRGDRHQHLVHG
jgi:hypothetical protein